MLRGRPNRSPSTQPRRARTTPPRTTTDDTTQDADKATAPADYTPQSTAATLSFKANEATATLSVATAEDVIDEPNETLRVVLASPSAGLALADATAIGTITDDDAAPTGLTLAVDADTGTEGVQTAVAEGGGAKTVRVTATLVGGTTFAEAQAVTVVVGESTDSATETADADYASVADQTITIPAGQSSATVDFTLTPADDDLDEGTEAISIKGTLGTLTATGTPITITDDDTRGVTVTPKTLTLAEIDDSTTNGTSENVDTYEVVLTSQPTGDVTVAITNPPPSPVTLSATQLTFTALNWDDPQTVTVTAQNDDIDNADDKRVVRLTHAVSGADYATETAEPVTVTVTDDDTATLSIADATGVEGGTITFPVTLSTASAVAVTVTVTTVEGSGAQAATAPEDYTHKTQELSFAAGDTAKDFTVTIARDSVSELDETFTVTLSGATGATITDEEATGTITGAGALLSIADASAAEGDVITFTVTRTGDTSGAASVQWTTTDDTTQDADKATAPADYTPQSTAATLSFKANEATATLSVATAEDVIDEPNETLRVVLASPSAGLALADATAIGTITDDDAAPTGLTLAVDENTVNEADATATAGADYTAVTNFDITISAGAASASGTFDLAPQQDTLHEGAETLEVTGVSSPLTVTKAEITIIDDDDAPSFAIADASATEGDAVTFTVTRSGATGAAATVKWNTAADTSEDATAAATSDYTAVTTAQTLSFAVSETTKTVTVATTADTLHEGDETFLVKLSAPTGGTTLADAEATGTITDDDAEPTGIALSVTPNSVAENAATAATVTVTATVEGGTTYATETTVNITVGDSDDSAKSDTDYAAVKAFDIAIPAGATSAAGTFSLDPTDDKLAEGDETLTVDGASSSRKVTATEVTITDDEGTPTATLVLTPASISENAASSTVTATLSEASSQTVTLTVDAAPVSPAVAGDFTLSASKTLTIAAGETSSSGIVTITSVNNAINNPDKTVTVSARATGGNGVANPANATLTVTDDDSAPNIAIADASAAEGEAITFTVTRSGATGVATTVKWNTAADSGAGAASTADYTAVTTARTLTFASGDTTKTFTVATTEDNLHEGDETFLVKLSAPTGGATIADAEATGTITDDDAAPTGITLTVDEDTVGEGDTTATKVTVTATVNGSSRYPDAKTVIVSVGGGTATSAVDYAAVANFSIAIPAGQASATGMFDFTPTQDTLYEGTETIDVTGASGSLAITKAVISLTDDDVAPSFTIADASATEGEVVTFTVTRSGATGAAATVKWNTADDSGSGAASAADYTAVTIAKTLTFAAGDTTKTFTVATTEDTLHEGDETFLVKLSDATGGVTIADDEATGTITDDDAVPTATLKLTPDVITESGATNTSTVTATLSTASSEAVTLTIAAVPVTPATAGDFTLSTSKTLTIAAGQTKSTGTVTVTANDNDRDNADRQVTISATADGGNDIDNPANVTLSITDDDETPSFAIADARAAEGDAITFTVTRSGATGSVATVKWNTAADSGDGAASASDYTAVTSAQTISFAVGDTTKTFTIATTEDTLHEGDETFLVKLSDATGGATISDATATGTITDDDSAPSFAVADASAAEGEAMTFTVTRSGATGAPATVKWNTAADSGAGAASAADYTAVTSAQTISFAVGDTTKTFTIATTEDTLHEGDETFLVKLSDATGGATISDATATGTITDDDAAPTGIELSVNPDSVAENTIQATTITVTVTLRGATTSSTETMVSITVGDSDDSAISGTDYAAVANFDIAIPAGDTSATGTFSLNPTDDSIAEGSEVLTVDGASGNLDVTEAEVTITDDDAAATGVTLSVDADTSTAGIQTSVSEDGGAKTVRVTATLGGTTTFAEDKDVTVTVGKSDDSAIKGTDYETVADQTITIGAGDTSAYVDFTLTPKQDILAEGTEIIALNGEADGLTVTDAEISLTDDDAAPTSILLAVAPDIVGEQDATTEITVTATIDGDAVAPTETVVTVSVGGGTATPDEDYGAVEAFTITVPAGQASATGTFDLTPTDDTVEESDETITVSGTSGDLSVTGSSITLADDDTTTTLALTVDADTSTDGIQTSVSEDGGAKTVRVTATIDGTTTFSEATNVTVTVGKTDDSATESTDYEAVADQTITIAAGESSAHVDFTLTPIQDTLVESTETIALDGEATGLTVTDTEILLTDDDAEPIGITLTVAPNTIGEEDATTEVTVTATINGDIVAPADTVVTVNVGGGG
ncbi:MAG: hypothetical protein OXE94_10115 [Aestuariivita sp.]|nr:hypothetical protein [Aestuariivita sp.]